MPPKKWSLPGIHVRGYTLQLFLFTLLPLTILVLVVAISSQNLHHEAMSALVGDRNLRSTRAAVAYLEQELDHRQTILTLLARDVAGSQNLDRLSLEPHQTQALFDGGLALVNAQGQVVAVENMSGEILARVHSAERPEPGQSKLWVDTAGGARQAALVFAANEAGQTLIGVARAAPLIETAAGNLGTGSRSALLVVGPGEQAGALEIIYERGQPDIEQAHLIHHTGVAEVMSGQSGIRYDHAYQEGEHVIVYSPIPRLGWGMIVEEPWEEIASPALRNTQLAPLVMIPILLLSVLALWYGAQSIVRPLNRLEKQSAALARGDFEAVRRPVGGIREIQNLQAALIDMAEKLYDARQSLHSYIGAMTAGIENERRSLARELHDDTIQSLIALNQRIQLAAKRAPESSKTAFSELQTLVQQTMLNLRRLIRGLRPIYLEDLGLVTALQMLAQETQESSGVNVPFQVSGTPRRLPTDHEMSLYRMAQESLHNAVRHAQAPTVEVRLVFTDEAVQLTVRDQGIGFVIPDSPAAFSHHGHFGLLGLQERAELIGARLEIASAPGQGTSVQITLPARAPQEDAGKQPVSQGVSS